MNSKSDFLSRDLIKESGWNQRVIEFNQRVSLDYRLLETGLKYTQGYAYSMHVVCKVYVLRCWCRLDAHYCNLNQLVCTVSAYIVCIKRAFAYLVHTIMFYTHMNSESVHIVCPKCVNAYLLHTYVKSLLGVCNVCIKGWCTLYPHYLSCTKFIK